MTDEDKRWFEEQFMLLESKVLSEFYYTTLMQPVVMPRPSADGKPTFEEMTQADVLRDKWLIYRNRCGVTKETSVAELSKRKSAFYAGALALYAVLKDTPDAVNALEAQAILWDAAMSGYMPFDFWKW